MCNRLEKEERLLLFKHLGYGLTLPASPSLRAMIFLTCTSSLMPFCRIHNVYDPFSSVAFYELNLVSPEHREVAAHLVRLAVLGACTTNFSASFLMLISLPYHSYSHNSTRKFTILSNHPHPWAATALRQICL